MKRQLAIYFLFFGFGSVAQSIDSVRVIPSMPTTATPVKVIVYGYFSTLTTFVGANATSLGGNVYQVDVHRCQGMLTAIDYTKDTVSLGLLSAGTYTALATMYSAAQDTVGNCPMVPTGNGSVVFTVMQSSGTQTFGLAHTSVYYDQDGKQIVITLPDRITSCRMKLLDISGRVVKEVKIEEKRTGIKADIPQGLYFISLDDGKACSVKKMMIN